MTLWTREMDATLRLCHEGGLSARIVANQLGVTRNAVIGRKFRLNMRGMPETPFCSEERKARRRELEDRKLFRKQERDRLRRIKRLIEDIKDSAPLLLVEHIEAMELILNRGK